ncbi:hypothetical protein [Ornithinimicrobium kibberense]|uniref:hypothetical protein n=1 Tax=Ornithinimicrobium kibberense TaxID=282060 RepID=UPI00361BC05F
MTSCLARWAGTSRPRTSRWDRGADSLRYSPKYDRIGASYVLYSTGTRTTHASSESGTTTTPPSSFKSR